MFFFNKTETDQALEVSQKNFKLLIGFIVAGLLYYVLLSFFISGDSMGFILILLLVVVGVLLTSKEYVAWNANYQKARLLGKKIVKSGNMWTGNLRINIEK